MLLLGCPCNVLSANKLILTVLPTGKLFQSIDNVVLMKLCLEKGETQLDDSAMKQEEDETGKWQTSNLQQLNNLQSKLMLVAGKAAGSKEGVDEFVEVLWFILSFSEYNRIFQIFLF